MTQGADLLPAGAVPVEPDRPRPWRTAYADGIAFVGRAMLAGLVCGALVGGVGGRLAMFVLRLTSSDAVRGMDTDDGFTIGVVTFATFFLIVSGAFVGAMGGLLYLVVRGWFPPRGRPVMFGLVGAALGGALFINPDGVDFTVVGPHWLAVALFVLLPAVYGVALSLLAERLLRPGGWQRSRWRWLAALPLASLLIIGPLALTLLVVIALIIGANRSARVARLWRSPSLIWLGRGLIAVILGTSGVQLARDVVAVL